MPIGNKKVINLTVSPTYKTNRVPLGTISNIMVAIADEGQKWDSELWKRCSAACR